MLKKILILGSGALKIGEAGEFDYSGSQAIKAAKEEGIKTILVNPNIATIQTSEHLADKVYFLPITSFFVEKIIQKEKPDGILISFGGQTALNCGIDLFKKKILKKYNVKILGTPITSVILTEDRQKFADHLRKINAPIPPSKSVSTIKEGLSLAKKIGFPVMIRAGFALGGQKSGMARNKKEFEQIASGALSISSEILVEKYLHHYKEIEYEIVRDQADNCVTVCNMENLDPLGIHTGESIVIAPSQTLTNFEYHTLRQKSIEIIRSLGIVGECNIQFAINPKSFEYYVIEVNARLSRSSALASKATGYPLAYVAAKLILGKNLTEVINKVTGITQSCFEPALDYVAVKIPRWDIEKFKGAEEQIGSSMKSVGEVMAIGRSFEETIQKAVRMLDIGRQGVTDNFISNGKSTNYFLKTPTPERLFAIACALKNNLAVEEIYRLTGIDPWFLYRIKNIVETEMSFLRRQESNQIDSRFRGNDLRNLKQLGFSDKKIANLLGVSELGVRRMRKKYKIIPSVFQIDTLAGEFPAKTNYLYTTYNGIHHDVLPLKKTGVMVLGSGPYRIGSSVEFDWTCVNTALALKKYQKKSILVNCNPETVSTDYDMSERLYFEELTFERVADIYEFENPDGIIISVGGQTPNNIAHELNKYGTRIFGTKVSDVDRVEDRKKFSELLDKYNILQPVWNSFTKMQSLFKFAKKVGYPVLIRPSYVLSGAAMNLCYDEHELRHYIKKATNINNKYPVIISKFITNAREIEFDGVAQGGKIKAYAIANHIEHAGVHSGDATIVYPAERVRLGSGERIKEIAAQLVSSLHISGPFNIQFMLKDNKVYVIEMNLRASRTFPFISKATGVNLAQLITDSFLGRVKDYKSHYPNYVIVKAAQFSFARIEGADPILRTEMASTGEVACFGETAEEAYLKSLMSTGFSLKKKTALVTVGGDENKLRFAESVWRLKNLGFKLYATKNTHKFLKTKGVKTKMVYKVYEGKRPNVADIINEKKVSLVINLSENYSNGITLDEHKTDGFLIRRATIDNSIPLITDLNAARFLVNALDKYKIEDLKIKSWDEYL